MDIKVFQCAPFEENTYLLYDDTREAVIIDAGCYTPQDQNKLKDFISTHNLTIKYLLNTHLHFDHLLGNNFVYDHYGLQTYAHKDDEYLLLKLHDQLDFFGMKNLVDKKPELAGYIDENDTIKFGNQILHIILVPGHTRGSVLFYNKGTNDLFSGDVLFKHTIGRTDLEGGNHDQLVNGIKTKLMVLPDITIVYSGHGPTTTIGAEKKYNPYLQ